MGRLSRKRTVGVTKTISYYLTDDDDVLPDVSVDGDTLSIPGNLSSLMGPVVTCEPEFVFKNSVT